MKKDNKYGLIDTKGVVKLYCEYDDIGISISNFSYNDITSQYILVDNLIPVQKDKLWGLVNLNGEIVLDFQFDSFGYIAKGSTNEVSVLEISNYNILIVEKDDLYGMVTSTGELLHKTTLDKIYMEINNDVKSYVIVAGENTYDAEEVLKSFGIETVEETIITQELTTDEEENITDVEENTDIDSDSNIVDSTTIDDSISDSNTYIE